MNDVDPERLATFVSERMGRRLVAVEPIAAGLGARRFFRLVFESGTPRTLVARCEPDATASTECLAGAAPGPTPAVAGPVAMGRVAAAPLALPVAPAWLPEPPLEPLRSFLESAGLPVPRSAGHFPEHGLELLEDVGTTSLLRISAAEREALYPVACALIPRLQRLSASPDSIPAFGRRYDAALVDTKRWKWLHWTIPGLLRRAPSAVEEQETTRLFRAIAEDLERAPRRLAHRDFKAENLHIRVPDGGDGPPGLVMIDVQGAFLAPPEYDLVCLLYDLQADLDEEQVWRWFEQTRCALPDAPDPETARRRFDAIAVARLCKDVSHVVHAALTRADWRRWPEIPHGLVLLERAAHRLGPRFPGTGTLISVIRALTTACEAADIAGEGSAR